MICLIISLVTFPINFFLKFVPEDGFCPMLGDEDPEEINDAATDYEILRAKGERNAKLFGLN